MEIRDELLSPFFIKASGESFDLYEEREVQDGKRAGELSEINRGYFLSLESALKRVTQLKVADSAEVATIKQYIETYKAVSDSLLSITQ
jgi:hypothetical protein